MSSEAMVFRSRDEAGRRLAETLVRTISGRCVVAGVPRGGVAVARPVAERLRAPLTVVYAQKLTAPAAPELAFGAVDEDGVVVVDRETVTVLGLRPDDVEQAKTRVREEIRRRMILYGVPPLARYLPGAAVVLVDDGLATGLTMESAAHCARRHGATDITVAVPCAAAPTVARLRRTADRVVGLVVDPGFAAVGHYYHDFSPVPDADVVAMLERGRAAEGARANQGAVRVSFRNSRGRMLAGELVLPAGRGPHPVVVFAHGWESGRRSPQNRVVAEALLAAGLAAFLFDFTGHGESEGTLEESTLAQQVDDLGAALDVVAGFDDLDAGRLAIAGDGSGAAAALWRAARDPRVGTLALHSPNPEGAEGEVPAVRAPTLLAVGEHDVLVRAANEELARRLGGPVRLVVVPKGDHRFTDPGALGHAATVMAEWLASHCGPAG